MSQVDWRKTDQGLKPFSPGSPGRPGRAGVWAPQEGSQELFLQCKVFEAIYEGTRGPGKTDALIMDFAQHVGTGFGLDWRGILFRQTYPELQDVIDKSKKWFPQIWPDAKFNEAKTFWTWATGEKLFFRQFQKPSDYWSYHGHAYPWIGWEELTTWPTSECFTSMFSCARSTRPGIPIKVRATTNPYGVGHNWVKARYRLPVPPGMAVGQLILDSRDKNGEIEPPRVAIHGHINENRILLTADPSYIQRIRAAARNLNELKAWLDGSWDIVAGGMLDDVWSPIHHVVTFPLSMIPASWYINRSYDHGSSKPFSVGFWAESSGEPIVINNRAYGSIRGDLFRIGEWYGWNGTPNEGVRMLAGDIAQGIIDRETDLSLRGRVRPGPADSAIFDDYEPGRSVGGDMAGKGVPWLPADKGPGSRKQGWEQIRKMLKASIPLPQVGRTEPGLFIHSSCAQWLRTVPTLPRDDKDQDDVDTKAEDHIGDETRYRCRWKRKHVQQGDMR